MCGRISCDAKPEWRPVLVIHWHTIQNYPPARAVMRVGICTACKYQVTIDDVMSDEGWDQLVAGLLVQGRPEPPRERLRLEWCGIRSKLSRQADKQHEPPS